MDAIGLDNDAFVTPCIRRTIGFMFVSPLDELNLDVLSEDAVGPCKDEVPLPLVRIDLTATSC